MSPWIALLLGIVEGLTEYLPVSSTGHLVLVSQWLGEKGDAAAAFDIVIQLGAILAVLVEYRRLLVERARGLVSRDATSVRFLVALVVGFVPTAIAGVLLRKWIKAHLFGPLPIAAALAVGGLLMIFVERRRVRLAPWKGQSDEEGLDKVTPQRAFVIGLGQVVSMWPGSSRSMCTIVAGQLTGLSRATSAEFSFLLGLPTLGAATIYEGWKSRHELGSSEVGPTALAIGLVVSFVVAWAVIRGFVQYLKRRGLEPFGVYRVLLGAIVLWITLR